MREYDIVGIIPPFRRDYLPIIIRCSLFTQRWRNLTTHQSQVIMDLCLTKPRAGKSRDDRDYISRKAPVSKYSPSKRKRKAGVFEFLRFQERFRKAALSWRISVDGRLKVAQNSFQHLNLDGSLQPLFITWCYDHGIKTLPNHWWTRCHHFLDTIGYHSNSITS